MMDRLQMHTDSMKTLGRGPRRIRRLFHTFRLVLAGITVLGASLSASAQVDLPRIVWHPQLEDYVSTSIIDDFRNNPLADVKGVQLCIWTFPDCALESHPHKVRYQDIQGILDDGYTLGTFIYSGCDCVIDDQIPMGARIVVADELHWRPPRVEAPEFIDIADACHEADADVLFVYSDVRFAASGGVPIQVMCEEVKDILSEENPPRCLSDVFDVLINMTEYLDYGPKCRQECDETDEVCMQDCRRRVVDADIAAMVGYVQEEGIKCATWVYNYPSASVDFRRYYLRKAYYQLPSLFIFQVPSSSGWLGAGGMRQELINMLESRFVIESGGGDVLAAFDRLGWLTLTVPSVQSASDGQLTPSLTDKEFIVRTGSAVLALLDESGMYFKGNAYESLTVDLDQVTGTDAFRVRNDTGQTVAMITGQDFIDSQIETESPYTVPAGSLLLKGELVD